jgi:transcriptional regulator GlxA family with amidase domain
LYSWRITGEGGGTQAARPIHARQSDLDELHRDDTMIPVAVTVQGCHHQTNPELPDAGEATRYHTGVLCTAAFSLPRQAFWMANAPRSTENHDSFTEEFLEVEPTKSVSRGWHRWTTAGGTSSIDLFLQIIADQQGEEVAVADQQIYSLSASRPRHPTSVYPDTDRRAYPKRPVSFRRWNLNIEDLISPSSSWPKTSVSTRLERLFRRVSEPVAETLLHGITPAKGAQPLMQTDMSVINVALACGFASPSHFKVLSCTAYKLLSRTWRAHAARCRFDRQTARCWHPICLKGS